MSFLRPILFSLAALLLAPSAAKAADDETCLAWVHDFNRSEDADQITAMSEATCLVRASSLEELVPEDGKPFPGSGPEWSFARDCAELKEQIREMRRALRQAQRGIEGARAALVTTSEAHGAFLVKEAEWKTAAEAVRIAKATFGQVHDVGTVIERDENGRVVVVRQVGYNDRTPLGRAVLEAMEKEKDARRAMEEAWTAWGKDTSLAMQAAQFRVSHYETVLATYPGQIAAAEALAVELGCA